VDYAMLEYCIREDLKKSRARIMAALDPVKLVIDNYPDDKVEYFEVANNLENEELGTRKVAFTKELYIDREDFMIEPPKKYFRLFPDNEVRLMNAYFVKCTGYETDDEGRVTLVHCTYDPETRNGECSTRKVKGTIHWVSTSHAVKAEVRLYENLVDEEKGGYNEEDGSLNLNPDSRTILTDCYIEESIKGAKAYDSFQFVRQGYFCVDSKDSRDDALVFNRIVSLKSSFKL
ncbi:MAG: glutamine--tRNA ligase, partial [Lachnospiraceae bacterium]|nr:glutamine--tRNA ligase [Lachnospiraceae bacterium]